jgi:hypothetical protein
MTNWDAVGAIGELVGGGAVLITLIYLVIQVRQHSRSISSITTQTNFAEFNDLTLLLASDPALVKAWERGLQSPESLTEDDAYRFTYVARALMNIYLNLYDQFVQGACPEYLWLRSVREIKAMYDQSPGLQQFRKVDPAFEDLFEYLEQMEDDNYGDMRSFHNFTKG